ncbi:MAG: hypothetical protein IV108_00710 [Burkholderiales bacterium]|nr:hypothetical protein [Burkholderiales bacterium]
MDPLSIIITGVALAALAGAVGVLLINRRQDKRRGAAEDAVAKAAQDYFARFQIRARTVGAQLPDDSMVLMVETPPHKKLRFSYIIEPPIKHFIHVQTGIEVARIFWRFPIPPKLTGAPDVKYADPDTIQLDTAQPSVDATAAPPPLPTEAELETDDYFHQHQTYHIEEVSWENFSTVTQSPAEAGATDSKPPVTKK